MPFSIQLLCGGIVKLMLRTIYKAACEYYGVTHRSWSELHETYSPYAFCKSNRRDFIEEYLFWETLIPQLQAHNIVYYYGINEFLKAYKKAVYSCLKDVQQN